MIEASAMIKFAMKHMNCSHMSRELYYKCIPILNSIDVRSVCFLDRVRTHEWQMLRMKVG